MPSELELDASVSWKKMPLSDWIKLVRGMLLLDDVFDLKGRVET